MASADADTDADADADDRSRLSTLGLGGLLSLCCIFAAPTSAGAVGGAAAAGTTAAAGGDAVRIAIAALTVGALAAIWHVRSTNDSCDA